MSKRFTIVAISVLVALLIASTGVALAQGNRPHTKEVRGTFTAADENVKQRFCQGEDGLYVELRGLFVGEIVSPDDDRLSGTLEFRAEPALVNVTTGLGTFRGPFHIFDPDTHRQKAKGEFHTVATPVAANVVRNHGFAVGKVTNQGGGPADEFFANFKSDLTITRRPDGTFASLDVTGQFGGTHPDTRIPAVIQGGHCSGRFTPVEP
jgi:hypothetical protein